MDNMEEKINSILGNPELMRSITAMAQSLGSAESTQSPAKAQPEQEAYSSQPFGDIDVNMLKRFSGLAKQGSIDKEQQNLLKALHPYLSRERLSKLENAMRAAKMAKFAAAALGSQGIKLSSSR